MGGESMMTAISDIPLKTMDGDEKRLSDYAGNVLLIVNTASKCGLTPQYEGLEQLYTKYRDEGLVVLGFPANDFREQEPGTDAEIADFCRSTYAVDFPIFSKISVAGPGKHPLYAALTDAQPHAHSGENGGMRARLQGYGITPNPEPEVVWNFEKFVIGRDGEVVARFAPDIAPNDDALVAALERELFASE